MTTTLASCLVRGGSHVCGALPSIRACASTAFSQAGGTAPLRLGARLAQQPESNLRHGNGPTKITAAAAAAADSTRWSLAKKVGPRSLSLRTRWRRRPAARSQATHLSRQLQPELSAKQPHVLIQLPQGERAQPGIVAAERQRRLTPGRIATPPRTVASDLLERRVSIP